MWERHNVAGQQAASQGRPAEAESQFQLALAEAQKLGPESAPVAQVLLNLANTYRQQGKYAEAEPAYKRALEIRERNVGALHKDTVPILENYAKMLRAAPR